MMRALKSPALIITALFFATPASAIEEAKLVTLEVNGALVTIPNSEVTLGVGQGIKVLQAKQNYNGDILINLTSPEPMAGFIVQNIDMADVKVEFIPKDTTQVAAIAPSVKNTGDRAYTYLPLASAKEGGAFTITLLRQPPLERKKKKGFLQ
jgi:hypothetical protein